jgi:outer membrane receptor for ferrienterochelin and colicins
VKVRYPLLAALLAPLAAGADEARTLPEVTVTASHDAQQERRAAVTQKTVLDQAEIAALGGLTVGEVIRQLPGIEAGAHTGDGGPSANARGMGRDAVQFLVDGERPAANARYALTAVGRLPAGELARIEILRGASAEHGGSAPITVNLVMKKARPQASTTVKAAVGQRGDEANGQFTGSVGGGDQGFSWILPVTVNHHAMPLAKKTARQASTAGSRTLWQTEQETGAYQLDEFILSPRLTWRAAGNSGSSLTLWPSLYHNQGDRQSTIARQAYADPANGSGLAADGGRRENESSRLSIARLRAEGETKIDGGKLSGRAAVMEGRRRSATDRRGTDALGSSTASRENLARDESEISSAVRVDRSAGDGLLSAGLEQGWLQRDERQQVSGSGAFRSRHDAASQQWTAWVQHEWTPLTALTLTGGLRGERIRLEADGRSKTAGQLAPSLAVRLELAPDLIFRSSLGAGIKAPKLDEISGLTVQGSGANSPLEADRAGNPDLVAERNLNWEIALDQHLPHEAGTVGANLYLRRTENFIERRTQLEGSRWVDRPYNEGSARHYGLELDAKLKTDRLGLKGGALRSHLTLPQGRVDDERLGLTRKVRDLPRYQFTLGYDQSLAFWQASAGFQLKQFGATQTEIADELSSRQQARTLLDIYLVRRLTPQLNLRFEAQNLLLADTRRLADARDGNDSWHLDSAERGQRTLLVSLEGKW